MRTLISSLRQFSKTDWVFFLIIAGFLAFNIPALAGRAAEMHKIRQSRPYPFLGLQFSQLPEILSPFPARIGYLTDKDLDQVLPGMQFSQAQYVLAPAVLDLNNVDHRYLLLDYSSKRLLNKTVAEHKLIPLKQSGRGVILAFNPEAADE